MAAPGRVATIARMATPAFTICVFCSSSEAVPDTDRAVAAGLGRAVAAHGWGLVYGGGNVGLMGELARAALSAGGHVTGVIPHRLVDAELALDDVTELIRTETMRERKAIMDARSDAFVVLPGGIGTLEELVEILTLKQLGYHDRPIVVLDPRGYWDPLHAQVDRMVDEGLANRSLRTLWRTVADVDAALDAVREALRQPRRAGEAGAGEVLEAVESPSGDPPAADAGLPTGNEPGR